MGPADQYLEHHRIPETIQTLIGEVLHKRPSTPEDALALIEDRLQIMVNRPPAAARAYLELIEVDASSEQQLSDALGLAFVVFEEQHSAPPSVGDYLAVLRALLAHFPTAYKEGLLAMLHPRSLSSPPGEDNGSAGEPAGGSAGDRPRPSRPLGTELNSVDPSWLDDGLIPVKPGSAGSLAVGSGGSSSTAMMSIGMMGLCGFSGVDGLQCLNDSAASPSSAGSSDAAAVRASMLPTTYPVEFVVFSSGLRAALVCRQLFEDACQAFEQAKTSPDDVTIDLEDVLDSIPDRGCYDDPTLPLSKLELRTVLLTCSSPTAVPKVRSSTGSPSKRAPVGGHSSARVTVENLQRAVAMQCCRALGVCTSTLAKNPTHAPPT